MQKLVRGNLSINDGIVDTNALGGDTSKWTLISMEKSRTPNTDLGPYTDRYYLIFNDGDGGQVKISGNYDPNTGRWDAYTFHYSEDQPTPSRWSLDGQIPPDEAPPEDPDFFMKAFNVTDE